jgi:hypothetical protein
LCDDADDFFLVQRARLMQAIKDYDASKWKAIGQQLGKPAKVGFSFLFFSSFAYSRCGQC